MRNLVLPLLGLMILGCGNSGDGGGTTRTVNPPEFPTIANDRYEQVLVTIDGKPVDAKTAITVGRDFIVTVSFHRLHVWPEMNNGESMLEAMIMEQWREDTLTHRYPTLDWLSEKDGVLTFTGKVEALQEPGVFGLWIKENVHTELPGVGRHFLFAANIRNVKR